MLRLVTTNNVEVFRHLGSPAFQRLGIDHRVAATFDDAQRMIREAKPTIAILDVELAGGSGYTLCRSVKDEDTLRGTHVILLLSSVITRNDLERIEASGCDDVLALPIYNDDFYHHLAQIANLPFRRDRRIGVTLECLIPDAGNVITGTVFNVCSRGVGVQLPARLENGQTVTVRFRHDGEVFPETKARVAWTKPVDTHPGSEGREEQEQLAGLTFDENVPIKTRLLLERLALFDVVPAPDGSPMAGGVTVSLQGDFTEITNFSALAKRLENERLIDFNAAAVRYISSAGVRGWCQFLRNLGEDKRYTFRHCSIAFASQAAMVPMVVGSGDVLSLEAPYFCETCDREELRLLETKALLRDGEHVVPPQLSCSTCGGELEFDDVPDRYFAFLRER
jgi:CheY-like chemotaxis protein